MPNNPIINVYEYYENCSELTVDNFVVEYTITTSTYKNSGGNITYACNGSISATPTKSFNKETGILTISGLSNTATYYEQYEGGYDKGSITEKITVSITKVMLIIEK